MFVAPVQPSIMFMLAVFGVCLGLIACFGPVVFIARWILTPIDRAAKSRQAPARFSIADFLCLFIIIQVPLAAINRLGGAEMEFDLWLLVIAAWVVGSLIWHVGARTLSKAGVAKNGHRFLYLGVILPLVYYGLLPYTILSCRGVMLLFENRQPWSGLSWGVSTWTILTALYYLSAWFTRWMLGKAQLVHGQHEDERALPEVHAA
jgi:hypothetical protein